MQIVLFKNNLDESHICFSFKLSCTRWPASPPPTFGEIRAFLCFFSKFSPDETFIQGAKYVSSPPISLTGQGSMHFKPPTTEEHVPVPPKGTAPSSRRSSVNSPAVLVNWGGFPAFSNTRPKALQARPPLLQKSPFHFEGQLNSILRAR